MSLENTIAENTAAIRELIAALAHGLHPTAAQVRAVVTESEATPAEEVTEAPAKPAKAKAKPAEAAPAADAADAADAPAVTYQDAATAVTTLSRAKGRDAAVAVLESFGAAKLPDVKPEQFAAVIAACEEALA